MKNQSTKKSEAAQRAEARRRRSDKQQLDLLAKRPGQSLRETARIKERVKTHGTDKLDKSGYVAKGDPHKTDTAIVLPPKTVKRSQKRHG